MQRRIRRTPTIKSAGILPKYRIDSDTHTFQIFLSSIYKIGELKLPEESLIVSVRRGNQLIIPHGYTRLRARDQLTIFADKECLPVVEQRLAGRPQN
ncbi:MAG: TrkA C-terminal domain-containing protein [Desulfobacterales bacterium]|jgi:NhaP-type Na+/H+ and K+/H+ antiporter